jgi:hypothetical protein
MGQFSNQETQKKIGEKVLKYVNDFYEVSAIVIEFGLSKVESVKKWIIEKIEILSSKLKALEETIHSEAGNEGNGEIKHWFIKHAETQLKDL